MIKHRNTSAALSPMEERFEKIFYASKDRLYYFVEQHIKRHDAIEDVVQQCYIRLWKNLSQVGDDEKILALLKTYAYHLVIDAYRKEARESASVRVYTGFQGNSRNTEENLDVREMMRRYQEAVNALPEKRRLIYRMVREKGWSHQEIAEHLQISTHTIERQVNEAMRYLRSKLQVEKSMLFIIILLSAV